MITKIINQNFPSALETASLAIKSGEVVAIPTDTVYGIGVSAYDEAGIHRLFEIKIRDVNKAIAILLSDTSQLVAVCNTLPDYAEKLAVAFWPGAITLVVPRHPALPEILSPVPTIGVRIPNHTFARDLIRICGPLAVTSANLTGERSSTNLTEVQEHMDGKINLIIDGGQTNTRISSTVVDCTGPDYRILRQGIITEDQIEQELKK